MCGDPWKPTPRAWSSPGKCALVVWVFPIFVAVANIRLGLFLWICSKVSGSSDKNLRKLKFWRKELLGKLLRLATWKIASMLFKLMLGIKPWRCSKTIYDGLSRRNHDLFHVLLCLEGFVANWSCSFSGERDQAFWDYESMQMSYDDLEE